MNMNWTVILLTSVVPLIMGFIYYNEKVLGKPWMEASGTTKEKMQGANMPMIFGMALLFSIMLAMSMQFIVIHQSHLNSIVANQPNFMDPTSEAGSMVKAMMDKYGHNFRTIKHGALHGFICSLFTILPVLGTNAMFERRGAKYIFISWGFWAINFMIMGGIICQFA